MLEAVTAYNEPRFLPAGDQAIVVELGDAIDPAINGRVHALLHAVEGESLAGVRDLVPSYRSLLVNYDPLGTSVEDLRTRLRDIHAGLDATAPESARTVLLPTLYGGDYGTDLDFVAENAGMPADEVVRTHSGVDYPVYMMGFTPGFPYLGGMPDALATPRLSAPRTSIPAGSVGIAESQTGVYPVESPGGWRLIGRTPLDLFDARRDPPALLAAGDKVRFVPLANETEFQEVRSQVESGQYRPEAVS